MDQISNEEVKIDNQIAFLDETLYYMQHNIDDLYRERKSVKYKLRNSYTLANHYLKLAEEMKLAKIDEGISCLNDQMRDILDKMDELYDKKGDILSKKGDNE